jgi:pyruvate dehydrogenase E2 component (dihydrolipoamide acetyltransferase)
MARLGIDPLCVQGSGPRGRILEADVLHHPHAPSAIAGQVREPSRRRRAIARSTVAAWAAVPHFHLRCEIDAGRLVEARQQILEVAAGTVRPSYTDFLLRALALALRDCPFANLIWHNGGLLVLPAPVVGLVVSLDDGLLIPTIGEADRLDWPGLAGRRAALVTAARSGRLDAGTTQPSATSLNNLGQTCVDELTPILTPPQSTMLAVGRLAARPFIVDGRLCARPTLRLTLAVDHRVLDGELAARFLGRIVHHLERPLLPGAQVAAVTPAPEA